MEERFYQFRSHEPAILVELFLPKKSKFQGTLYDTLVNGFTPGTLQAHLMDPANRPGIKKMLLQHYPHIVTDETLDELATQLANKPVFFGYSLYEVDGVFYSQAQRSVIEERTQVIKIIFKPDYETLSRTFVVQSEAKTNSERLSELANKFFGMPKTDPALFLATYKLQLSEIEFRYIQYLDTWVDKVALFLFGYLVFEITEKIVDLSEEGAIQRAEEELWVASTWNFSINRVVFHNED